MYGTVWQHLGPYPYWLSPLPTPTFSYDKQKYLYILLKCPPRNKFFLPAPLRAIALDDLFAFSVFNTVIIHN
jgi:hypothetical protein